jgi:hypothetical protein
LRSRFVLLYPPLMPRDAILLSDKRVPTIGIFCALCQRRETFDVESLKLQHGGDVKMPDLLALLVADCPKRQQRAFSVYDRCRVTYDKASRSDFPATAQRPRSGAPLRQS